MNSFAYAQEEIAHVIQKGETVSDILFNRNISPIYGRKGFLKGTLKLNPYLVTRKGNKVYPGDVVLIKYRSLQFTLKEGLPEKKNKKSDVVEQIHFTNDEANRSTASSAPVPLGTVIQHYLDQSSYWSFIPSIYWQTLDAVHENIYRRSEIHSYSNNNYAFVFLGGKQLEKGINLYTRASLNFSSFEMGQEDQVVTKKFTTSSFYVGAEFYKKYQLELGMEDKLYLLTSAPTSADMKKIKVPKISIGRMSDFYQYKSAVFSGELNGKVYLPRDSVSIKGKTGYGAGGELKMKFSNQAVSIGLEKDFLKAQEITTNSQLLFLKFKWDIQ
jgi:hypothetical protein